MPGGLFPKHLRYERFRRCQAKANDPREIVLRVQGGKAAKAMEEGGRCPAKANDPREIVLRVQSGKTARRRLWFLGGPGSGQPLLVQSRLT